MKEIKIICRRECVQPVLAELRAAGVPRLTVSHVHALGSGVDPEHFRLSFEEGSAYTEKAKIELVCREEDVDRLLAIACSQARTGSRGDGVAFVSDVDRVVKIRTGEHDALALL